MMIKETDILSIRVGFEAVLRWNKFFLFFTKVDRGLKDHIIIETIDTAAVARFAIIS